MVDGVQTALPILSHIDGVSFQVGGGVTLALPAATSYDHASPGNSQYRMWRAQGVGSQLDLNNLTSITGGTQYNSRIQVDASNGGVIDLRNVTQVLDPDSGDTRLRAVELRAKGAGSTIDLGALVNFIDVNRDTYSLLSANNLGSILAGNLQSATGVNVVLDRSGSMPISQLEQLHDSQVDVTGIDRAFTNLTSVPGTSFLREWFSSG